MTLLGVLRWGVLRLCPSQKLNGFRVVFADLSTDRMASMNRISAALGVLDDLDARRGRQVRQRVRVIVLWSGNYSGALPPQGIQLCPSHFMESTSLELASVFVHEATHLRIASLGIRYSPATAERIERICLAEQTEFLRRTPGVGSQIASALEGQLDSAWWSESAHHGHVEEMVKRGTIPRWMARIVAPKATRERDG
jgi:hypothetical protein